MLLMKRLRMSSQVRYHLKHSSRWKEYALKIAKAAEDVLEDVRVYVIREFRSI